MKASLRKLGAFAYDVAGALVEVVLSVLFRVDFNAAEGKAVRARERRQSHKTR